MKAVILERQLHAALMLPPSLSLVADSAITQASRPIFLPDFDCEWTARFHLAVRVSRLGKNVSAKFGSRYYDAITLAMQMIPVTLVDELHASQRSVGLTGLFDNALVMGQWITVDSIDLTNLSIAIGEADIAIEHLDTLAAEAIAQVSQYATIKMGDMITIAQMPSGLALRTGLTLNATIAGNSCLTLRIR